MGRGRETLRSAAGQGVQARVPLASTSSSGIALRSCTSLPRSFPEVENPDPCRRSPPRLSRCQTSSFTFVQKTLASTEPTSSSTRRSAQPHGSSPTLVGLSHLYVDVTGHSHAQDSSAGRNRISLGTSSPLRLLTGANLTTLPRPSQLQVDSSHGLAARKRAPLRLQSPQARSSSLFSSRLRPTSFRSSGAASTSLTFARR